MCVSLQAGERHRYDAPVCSLVLRQLKSIESTLFPDLSDAARAAQGSVEATDISGTGDAVHHHRYVGRVLLINCE